MKCPKGRWENKEGKAKGLVNPQTRFSSHLLDNGVIYNLRGWRGSGLHTRKEKDVPRGSLKVAKTSSFFRNSLVNCLSLSTHPQLSSLLGTIARKWAKVWKLPPALWFCEAGVWPFLLDSGSNTHQYLNSTFLWCPTQPLLFPSKLCMRCIFSAEIWQLSPTSTIRM